MPMAITQLQAVRFGYHFSCLCWFASLQSLNLARQNFRARPSLLWFQILQGDWLTNMFTLFHSLMPIIHWKTSVYAENFLCSFLDFGLRHAELKVTTVQMRLSSESILYYTNCCYWSGQNIWSRLTTSASIEVTNRNLQRIQSETFLEFLCSVVVCSF